MVLSPDKCPLMLFGVKNELQANFVSNNVIIENSEEEKVLGITIDSKLDFSTHLTNITKKTNIKLNALTGVQKYMTPEKKGPFNFLFYNLSI